MLGHSGSNSNNASSQYIRPDYLSPLPSTMDAQKSPLAMLAATCNSIGAPDLPSKNNIKSVDLPPSSKKSSPISTGGSENKRPRRSPDCPAETTKPEKKPSAEKHHDKHHEKDEGKSERAERKEKVAEEKPEKPVVEREERKASKSPSTKRQSPPPKSSSVISPLPPQQPLSAPMSFSSLSSPVGDPMNFASRLKPPMQMPGMMPYCRDPFCYGCSQNMHCGTNPAVPMDYSALSSYSSLSNGLSSNKNFTCNWVSPGEPFCGKRFLSSEELFSHLRTHTNLSVSGLSNDLLQNAYTYASYLNRFPASLVNAAAASRYSNPMYKSPVPGMTSPMSYGGLWPSTPTPGFFSPSPYSYYRPPF